MRLAHSLCAAWQGRDQETGTATPTCNLAFAGPIRASDLRDIHCDSQRSAFFTSLSDAGFDMVAQNVAFELSIMR